MQLTAESLPDDPSITAFLYGPLALTGQFPATGLNEKLLHKSQGPEVD